MHPMTRVLYRNITYQAPRVVKAEDKLWTFLLVQLRLVLTAPGPLQVPDLTPSAFQTMGQVRKSLIQHFKGRTS